MIRRRAGTAISPDRYAQVELVNHLHNEARQMLLRQPLVDRRRKQKSGLPIKRAEIAHRRASISMQEST
jgi:hypothetical protein